MKLLIVTDAFSPQTNGVVRTIETTIGVLEKRGWTIGVIHPAMFSTMGLPTYAEIRIPLSTTGLAQMMIDHQADYIHIATEGRLGWAARKICQQEDWCFTTAYHTDFPGYLERHFRIPARITYRAMKRFHSASSAVMVATPMIERQLRRHGIGRIVRWGRGVDLNLFQYRHLPTKSFEPPCLLHVGRVSKEKNLEAFFALGVPGRKVVVGDGPMLAHFRDKYPEVEFTGKLTGADLAHRYQNADVLVFPSRTDTFGLVMIEAMACGTPVAAYPVQGPVDVLAPDSGVMDNDLDAAVRGALKLDRKRVSRFGQSFSWDAATDQFVAGLVPVKAK